MDCDESLTWPNNRCLQTELVGVRCYRWIVRLSRCPGRPTLLVDQVDEHRRVSENRDLYHVGDHLILGQPSEGLRSIDWIWLPSGASWLLASQVSPSSAWKYTFQPRRPRLDVDGSFDDPVRRRRPLGSKFDRLSREAGLRLLGSVSRPGVCWYLVRYRFDVHRQQGGWVCFWI